MVFCWLMASSSSLVVLPDPETLRPLCLLKCFLLFLHALSLCFRGLLLLLGEVAIVVAATLEWKRLEKNSVLAFLWLGLDLGQQLVVRIAPRGRLDGILSLQVDVVVVLGGTRVVGRVKEIAELREGLGYGEVAGFVLLL